MKLMGLPRNHNLAPNITPEQQRRDYFERIGLNEKERQELVAAFHLDRESGSDGRQFIDNAVAGKMQVGKFDLNITPPCYFMREETELGTTLSFAIPIPNTKSILKVYLGDQPQNRLSISISPLEEGALPDISKVRETLGDPGYMSWDDRSIYLLLEQTANNREDSYYVYNQEQRRFILREDALQNNLEALWRETENALGDKTGSDGILAIVEHFEKPVPYVRPQGLPIVTN